jgi:hypothetical protein
MKLLLTGAEGFLTEAEARCDVALKTAARLSAAAHARYALKHNSDNSTKQPSEDLTALAMLAPDLPIHLLACFAVECAVTEAEVNRVSSHTG